MKIFGFLIYHLDFLNSARPKNLQFYNEEAFFRPLFFMQRSNRMGAKIFTDLNY